MKVKPDISTSKIFTFPITVFYEDTDAGGIVYHANYLKFMERARSQWLRKMGFSHHYLLQQNIAFVIAKITIDYQRPALLEDELEVKTILCRINKVSLEFEQVIYRDAVIIVSAQVIVACTYADSFKLQRLPETLTSVCRSYVTS